MASLLFILLALLLLIGKLINLEAAGEYLSIPGVLGSGKKAQVFTF